MKKLTVGILIFGTMVFCADMTKAEVAYQDYLQYKSSVQTVFAKADNAINEILVVVGELRKELEEAKELKVEEKE